MSSAIRYARNGDVNIACKTVGSGPQDLIFIQGNITNLDILWGAAATANSARDWPRSPG